MRIGSYADWVATLPVTCLLPTLNSASKIGNNVRFATKATAIANPVSKPKYMVGMKFDSANIEKPMMIVMEV